MRALSMALYALLPLAGCADDDFATAEPLAEVIGSLERIDPQDPASAWIGTELVRTLDAHGDELCVRDLDLDAVEAGADETCASCDITLDVVRSALQDLDTDCDDAVEHGLVSFPEATLAWQPKADKENGRVLISEDDWTWDDYAGGVFDGETLVYRRVVYLPVDSVPTGGPYPHLPDNRYQEPPVIEDATL